MKTKFTSRAMALLMALIMCVLLLPQVTFATGDDVLIGTYFELLEFAEAVNTGTDYAGITVKLTNDIDLNGSASAPWAAIGTSANSFKGTFDGDNHIVSGLYINATTANQGFFGYISGGVVRNLTVSGEVRSSGGVAAGIVGYCNNTAIENCHNAANVTGTGSNMVHRYAGVAAWMLGTSSVTRSLNTGTITGTGTGTGGIAGTGRNITYCYNAGTIIGGSGATGGIAAQNGSGTALGNYNIGTVSMPSPANLSPVIGQNNGGSVTESANFYLDTSFTGTPSVAVTAKTAAEMKAAAFITELNGEGNGYIADGAGINEGYPVFSWQHVRIGTYFELLEFANKVNAGTNYSGITVKLTANIDLGGSAANPWTAIGTSSNPFRGTFDGGYHVINGLYINATTANQGFFGVVNGGTVKNLKVSGTVTTTAGSAAGIVGYTAGNSTVENCHNAANVTSIGTNMVHRHAGIVGWMTGTNDSVTRCLNTGTITGSGTATGGIAGTGRNLTYNYNAGTIVGGSGATGGIAGQNQAGAASNNYNIGTVSMASPANLGPVIGQNNGGSAVQNANFYLDTSITGANSSVAVTAKTETEMKNPAFLAELNGTGDAYIADEANINGGYPILSWQLSIAGDTAEEFVEASEWSNEIAGYVRSAINRRKTAHGLSLSDSLLSHSSFDQTSTGNDWIAVTMGAYSYYDAQGKRTYLYPDGDGYASFLAALEADVTAKYAANNGLLDTSKPTEWQRAILAIQALGGDPLSFGTYNGNPIDMINDGIYNHANIRGQGFNAWVYGLLALDTKLYEVPEGAINTREDFITELLKVQCTDGVNGNSYGGWALGGNSTDPDMCAMAIQALAPYYFLDDEYTYTNINNGQTVTKTVRTAINEALEKLSAMQRPDGDFASWGTINCESTAQVLCALVSVGLDPLTDTRFIKGGNTLIDGILKYRNSDGGFGHTNKNFNSMANDQASYALAAYWRHLNSLRSLYDYRDGWDEATRGKIDAAVDAINAVFTADGADYKATLKTALQKFREVDDNEKRYVFNYSDMMLALEGIGGEAELDTNTPVLMSIEVTTLPDKTAYAKNETFDTTGMVVTAYYSDGTNEAITDYTFMPSGGLTLGDTSITIIKGIRRATVTVSVSVWAGAGTADNPYLIESWADLDALRDEVNTNSMNTTGLYFKLTNDIDFSSHGNWAGIGNSSLKAFKGHFDGDYHVVKNITITGIGFFGYMSGDAVIENFGIASGTASGSSYAGGLVGYCNGGSILNCWNGANVSGSRAGGIISNISTGASINIERCYNKGTINSSGDHAGIVGWIDDSSGVTIKDCYNAGTITGSSSAGIVGRVRSGNNTITNCYNIGLVPPGGNSGAIVSLLNSGGVVSNTYYLDTSASVGVNSGQGSHTTYSKTESELKDPAFITAIGSAFKADFTGNPANNGYPVLVWQTELSSDASLSLVKIGYYEAELTGEGIYSATIPADRLMYFVNVIPTSSKATVSEILANTGYTQWTFTVTAQDGTQENYVINVTVLENISLIAGISIFEPVISGSAAIFEIDSNTPVKYFSIAAAYNADDILTGIEVRDLDIGAVRTAYPISFAALTKPDGGKIKVFIIKDTGSIMPITNKVIVME